MSDLVKRMVWFIPASLHRLIKAEAARQGLTITDYAIKVFSKELGAGD